jgi:integrase/recombinase XerD
MLETYLQNPSRLALIQRMGIAPYLEGFITEMVEAGYPQPTIQRHLRIAVHVGAWLQKSRRSLADLDARVIEDFKQHLADCRCRGFKRSSKTRAHGANLFLRYCQKIDAVPTPTPDTAIHPQLFEEFCHWMRQHRGARNCTLRTYGWVILDALRTLGQDPQQFNAAALRGFVLERANRHSRGTAKLIMTAVRTFVRYLVSQGHCAVGLDAAIPTIAGWRLAALPRHLPATDVERVLAACDPTTPIGARDRAILLLLSRLGFRAGDVCNLRLQDINWTQATIHVMGKSRRAVQLPLPQEIGDALLHYLSSVPRVVQSDYLFLRMRPPLGRFLDPSGISCIVARAIERAGVSAPTHGAHLLRNSAATSLLAQGASLESIGTLLRHRSLDTTTLYAKVDFDVLRELAQPWPEVCPC